MGTYQIGKHYIAHGEEGAVKKHEHPEDCKEETSCGQADADLAIVVEAVHGGGRERG